MTSLSVKDKDTVKASWDKVPGKEELIGADDPSRTVTVYPQVKTYFSHWDLSPGSAQVKKHGKSIMAGFGEAVAKMDDLTAGDDVINMLTFDLSHKQLQNGFATNYKVATHAFTLRVDPAKFKILSDILLVVLARTFPKEFTPEVHVSMDKFLSRVSYALSEKPHTEASAVSAQ